MDVKKAMVLEKASGIYSLRALHLNPSLPLSVWAILANPASLNFHMCKK